MFRGEINHTVDAKGRVIIPAKFRDQLGDKFVITKGLDECLFIFPAKEWGEFEAKVAALPISDKSARRFVRTYIGAAFDAEIDQMGRTIIPQNLREYAKVSKEAVLVGAINRLELWSVESWKDYNLKGAEDEDAAEKMAQFGI